MEKIFTTREIERMKNRIKKLQWDGKDHIGELEKYIKAKNADFGKEIEKALVRGLKIFLEEEKSFGKTRDWKKCFLYVDNKFNSKCNNRILFFQNEERKAIVRNV